jgi:hypothetical protein
MIITLGTVVPRLGNVAVAGEQDPAGSETGTAPDPARDFAALMSGAAAAADPGAGEAPYGWLTDPETGVRRPKKTRGRPRRSPSLDDLKAARAEASEAAPGEGPAPGQEDRPPSAIRRRRTRSAAAEPGTPPPAPPYQPGVITKGVNRLYRRAGKIVRAMDRPVGIAITEATRNTDEDGGDDSVGAAWEEVARTNPRIRGFLLRCIAGGAWGQLLMVHAPILLAILLKDGIRARIPGVKLIEAFLDDGEDQADGEPGGLSGLMGDLRAEDLQQMAGLAQKLMGGMAGDAGRAAA